MDTIRPNTKEDNWCFRVRGQRKDTFLPLLLQFQTPIELAFKNSLGSSLVMDSISEWHMEIPSFCIHGHRATLPDSTWKWEELAPPFLCRGGGGRRGHGSPLPSYHEAWGTGAAPSDAVAVGAVLTGARQLAAIAIVASRAGFIAVVARPPWLAGASSSYWVAAEQMREE